MVCIASVCEPCHRWMEKKVKSQISAGQKSISCTILYWSQGINSFWIPNQSVIKLFWGLNSHIWVCGFFSSPVLIWSSRSLLALRTRSSLLSPVYSAPVYWDGSNFSLAQCSLYWHVLVNVNLDREGLVWWESVSFCFTPPGRLCRQHSAQMQAHGLRYSCCRWSPFGRLLYQWADPSVSLPYWHFCQSLAVPTSSAQGWSLNPEVLSTASITVIKTIS